MFPGQALEIPSPVPEKSGSHPGQPLTAGRSPAGHTQAARAGEISVVPTGERGGRGGDAPAFRSAETRDVAERPAAVSTAPHAKEFPAPGAHSAACHRSTDLARSAARPPHCLLFPLDTLRLRTPQFARQGPEGGLDPPASQIYKAAEKVRST